MTSRAETPSEQAGLLRRAAAVLGADRPLVLGHSFGGTIALAWALGALIASGDAPRDVRTFAA